MTKLHNYTPAGMSKAASRLLGAACIALFALAAAPAAAQTSAPQTAATGGADEYVNSDNWVMTDALGRHVACDPDSFPLRSEKQVMLFYTNWHQWTYPEGLPPLNVSKIMREHPEAAQSMHHEAWHYEEANSKGGNHYYWEEPLFGYYCTTDPWVVRKHAEMLADAKIDAVIFDCSNGDLTWDASLQTILDTWMQARRDGVRTPQITFLMPFGAFPYSRASMTHLYTTYFLPGKYDELWFRRDGKPMLFGYTDNFHKDDPTDQAILKYFTFRNPQPDYVQGPINPEQWTQWAWLEVYPQHGFGPLGGGKFEECAVGVAQNACDATGGHCTAFNRDGTYGRSYSKKYGRDTRPNSYLYGANFNEQWERAYEIDPQLVFVTGWNEWTASMYDTVQWHGRNFSFVDEYDWEHSRDIEPNKGWGDKGDVYYSMLVDRVRRFKGLQKPDVAPSTPRGMHFDSPEDWQQVMPAYRDYRGDVMHRNGEGAFRLHYTNTTGRNDIVEARVAKKGAKLAFYVRTDSALTPREGSNWMVLFIDADNNRHTGWEGFEYAINRSDLGKGYVSIERCTGTKWSWQAVGRAKCSVSGDHLVIIVPRKLAGLAGGKLNFAFKWSDNMQEAGNPMDFYVNGDTAPSARFAYQYKEK